MAAPKTLLDAIRYFTDYQNCHDTVSAMRWPDGRVICPRCQSDRITYMASVRRWKCYAKHKADAAGKVAPQQFSLKVGTIFEDSPIGLEKWLPALWLLTNCKNGISSYEVARALGVTQKTAWFMLSRLRHALKDESTDMMNGEVEADETYIGGRVTNMHADKRERFKGSRWAGKVAVMGLLERTSPDGPSRVRTAIVKGTKRKELLGVIKQHVELGSELMTDALPSYASFNHLYVHQFIDHMEAYGRGAVHTNGLENFWSLVKRALKGTYISVEPFHLTKYLDEQSFRFNLRRHSDAERFVTGLRGVLGKRMTWATLTGSEVAERC